MLATARCGSRIMLHRCSSACDEVLWISLRIIVDDKDAGRVDVVHRRVVQVRPLANIRRGLIDAPLPVLANEHLAREHMLYAVAVRLAPMRRVPGVDVEVGMDIMHRHVQRWAMDQAMRSENKSSLAFL